MSTTSLSRRDRRTASRRTVRTRRATRAAAATTLLAASLAISAPASPPAPSASPVADAVEATPLDTAALDERERSVPASREDRTDPAPAADWSTEIIATALGSEGGIDTDALPTPPPARVAPATTAATTAVSGSATAATTSVPVGSASVEEVKAQTRALMLELYGWGEAEFSCLNSLWQKESGWRWNADNPSSSAYGIPQALPGSKMSSAGADWETNPITQVRWGLSYIDGRYGSPCAAWQHSVDRGWY